MTGLAHGVLTDLRQRRLLPVAALLAIAIVAVPLVGLKSSADTQAPAAPATQATQTSADGLPTPQQALAGNDKPLVSLAVLDQPSDLEEFESKNPFEPIDQVADGGAGTGSGGSPGQAPDLVVPPVGGGGGAGGGGGTPSLPSGGGGGGSNPTAPTAPAPEPGGDKPDTRKPPTKLTYALDLAIRGPKGLRTYRGLPKLSLLPAQDNPLLVFLGVEEAGTKAVFLVDAKLTSKEGEGTCSPAPDQCATLAMAPGERHVLTNDQGETWTLEIVEVRQTTVARAAAAARKAEKRRASARKATRSVGQKPAPRFIPTIITDLFTGGRS